MVFEETYLTVNKCRIRLWRGGEGPTVLYLHGANGAMQVQPFMENLAQDFTVLVPEHPGFGYSDEPDWLDDIHDLAYFYLDFIKEQGLDSVHVIGSSLGGWLAMEMAIRNPQCFASLTLVGTAGVRVPEAVPGDIFLWNQQTMVRNTFHNQAIAERLLAAQPTTPEEQEAILKNKHTVARLAWQPRLFDPSLPKWLHRIDLPVRLIWGAQDKIMPVACGQALKQMIPNAELQVFEECGHLPQVEYPSEFSQSVREFIATTEGVKLS